MNGPYRDGWLVIVGVGFALAAIGGFYFGGHWTLMLASPALYLLIALAIFGTVLGLRSGEGVRFHWWAVALLTVWMIGVTCYVGILFVEALAAV